MTDLNRQDNQSKLHESEKNTDNRALHTRRDDDSVSNFKIGLEDIDTAIITYMVDTIKPKVEINGNYQPVPVIYGSPERWKSVQTDGFYRDKKKKIQIPLIMIRRTNTLKNRELSRNLDANNPKVFQSFEVSYNQQNRYDKFSILTNASPVKEYHNVVIPEYVIVNYECVVWTDYLKQLNAIEEAISYAESSYWGIPNKFRFYTTVSDFTNTTELENGNDRLIRANFDLVVNSYVITDTIQKEINQLSQKTFSFSKIKFGDEQII